VSSTVRSWSPILYSHFHVPTGSTLPPCAPARPHSPPSINVAERITFMIASKEMAGEKLTHADRPPPADRNTDVSSHSNDSRDRATGGLSASASRAPTMKPLVWILSFRRVIMLLRGAHWRTSRQWHVSRSSRVTKHSRDGAAVSAGRISNRSAIKVPPSASG